MVKVAAGAGRTLAPGHALGACGRGLCWFGRGRWDRSGRLPALMTSCADGSGSWREWLKWFLMPLPVLKRSGLPPRFVQ